MTLSEQKKKEASPGEVPLSFIVKIYKGGFTANSEG